MPVDLTLDSSGRVVEPEGKQREYKLNLDSKERVLQAVVAFANSAGGQLVVGVADDGTVVGVADPLVEQQRLAHLIADGVRPQLAPPIDLVTLAGKTLLVADIGLGSQRPYFLKVSGRYGGTYYRSAAGNVLAGASMVDDIERSARKLSFDLLPCVDAELTDLDLDALSKLLGRDLTEAALRSGGLARTEQGRTVPTNAGVLVASPHPERFLPHAWVQCARFRGPRKRDITDQEDIKGPLPIAVEQVMKFLKRNAFLSAEFGSGPRRREDVWSIPLEPLKELVVNALVHSSYADHGTPIKIAFLDDEIRIESPGGLVPGMTVEKMRSGESSIRNPVLAAIFKELGFIEAWGTGIPEVFADLAELGLPAPDIEEGHERLRITVHIPNHDPLRYRVAEPGKEDVTEDVKEDEGQQDQPSQAALRALGTYGQRILSIARSRPVSRSEIMAAIGLADTYGAFTRHIVPLVEARLLERTIPDKPRARTQRYALTEVGRQALAALNERRAS